MLCDLYAHEVHLSLAAPGAMMGVLLLLLHLLMLPTLQPVCRWQLG
jgi:hypothetical protein